MYTVAYTNSSTTGFLGNMRIRNKILMGYLLLIGLMGIIVGVGIWGVAESAKADDTARKRVSDIADLWAMQFYLSQQYEKQANLIINNDSKSIDTFHEQTRLMDEKKNKVRQSA